MVLGDTVLVEIYGSGQMKTSKEIATEAIKTVTNILK